MQRELAIEPFDTWAVLTPGTLTASGYDRVEFLSLSKTEATAQARLMHGRLWARMVAVRKVTVECKKVPVSTK